MNRITKYSVNILLSLLSIFFVLGLFELFLAYDDYFEYPRKTDHIIIEGTKYGFIERTGVSFFSKSDPKTKDVFVIGDSFVEGIHCQLEREDFPSRLQVHLDGRYKVHNLGMGGRNISGHIDFVSNLELDNSDTVLVVLYDNDNIVNDEDCLRINRQALSNDLYIPDSCSQSSVGVQQKTNTGVALKINNRLKQFKTFELIKESAINIPFLASYFSRTAFLNKWNEYDHEDTKLMISSITLLEKIVKDSGANIEFTYYPNTNAISASDPRHLVWKEFISYMSANKGVKIDDPYPYFIDNATSDSMVWSLTDKHPSCPAHEIMARHIANSIFN